MLCKSKVFKQFPLIHTCIIFLTCFSCKHNCQQLVASHTATLQSTEVPGNQGCKNFKKFRCPGASSIQYQVAHTIFLVALTKIGIYNYILIAQVHNMSIKQYHCDPIVYSLSLFLVALTKIGIYNYILIAQAHNMSIKQYHCDPIVYSLSLIKLIHNLK